MILALGIAAMVALKTPIDGLLPAILFGALVLSLALSSALCYRQFKRVRATRLYLKQLNVIYRSTLHEHLSESAQSSQDATLIHQRRYREDMPDLISQFREEANRNRRIHNRIHNRWQIVMIVGSVAASAVATASAFFSGTRWFSVAITALVDWQPASLDISNITNTASTYSRRRTP
ncbi:hypothetical protein AAH979_01790 [Plantactinospora sp. ZYX-F-223]|uniref:hypothetical protein n=1 Tax=Plantactinospora sp. ZYX-F-223 TaxID=3144103 RepID=UPI0031FCC0AD